MNCRNCGASLPPDAVVCRKCGSTVERPQPQPQQTGQQPINVILQPTPQQHAAAMSTAQRHADRAERREPALLWKGRSRFVYYIPGLLWATGWFLLWRHAYVEFGALLAKAGEWDVLEPFLTKIPRDYQMYGRYVVGVFALLAAWGVVKRVLGFITNHYEIYENSVKLREGLLSSEWKHLQLSRMKSLTVHQSLWGRIWNYAVIDFTSSSFQFFRLKGIPDGVRLADRLRAALPRR
ncbi:MAG: PH domain-containing protein [Candidatus Hydrogenedentota bacterium]